MLLTDQWKSLLRSHAGPMRLTTMLAAGVLISAAAWGAFPDSQSPPPGWTGLRFKLSQDYPTVLPLVVINGVPRFGTPALFSALKVSGETVKIGSASRRLFLTQDTQDPQVGKISLSHAAEALQAALKKLPALAKKLEKPKALMRGPSRDGAPVWREKR